MAARRAALIVALLAAPSASPAAPADEATAAVERWAAAFNAGDVERVVATYAADASVHGTTAPDLAVGSDALRAYFAPPMRARVQVKMGGDAAAVVLSPAQVVAAGHYEFSGTRPDGQAFALPARYTFVLALRDGTWRIVHHHSSPRPRPAQ